VRLFRRRREPFDLWSRVRELGPPDWSRISEHIEGAEQIGAQNGWFIPHPMSPIDYGTDQPCTVFLTNHGIYIDVRPDASIIGSHLIAINPYGVKGSAVILRPEGVIRFACLYVTNYGPDGEDKEICVDFEQVHSYDIADKLEEWGKRFVNQSALHHSVMEDMERGQDDQHA
jgi:hypothetical protein